MTTRGDQPQSKQLEWMNRRGATETCDIIVIGGGSAAFEAAVAARQAGAQRVVMLEKAPEAEYGGNARYSGTGFRFVHGGAQEIRAVRPGGGRRAVRHHDDPALRRRRFHGRSRPHDARAHEPRSWRSSLVEQSNAAVHWMRQAGITLGAAEGARQGRRQALFRARHRHPCGGRRHRPAHAMAADRRSARDRDPVQFAGLRRASATCGGSRASRSAGRTAATTSWPRP